MAVNPLISRTGRTINNRSHSKIPTGSTSKTAVANVFVSASSNWAATSVIRAIAPPSSQNCWVKDSDCGTLRTNLTAGAVDPSGDRPG
ncbi:MAG: hypothetical protein HC879_21435 [Leptolyngbyaceae cyanobacterium SL_5_9]|nr:hypothetical protein [Leptolyngbyaceae cyanobacterium SL_5_9]